MRQFLFLLVCLTALTCCDHENEDKIPPIPACGFSNPLEDLAWLKEIKETLTNCDQYTTKSIDQAVYEEQTVFYVFITNTDPAANTMFRITVWNCEGEEIRTFQYDEKEEFYELVTDMVPLYSCK